MHGQDGLEPLHPDGSKSGPSGILCIANSLSMRNPQGNGCVRSEKAALTMLSAGVCNPLLLHDTNL